MGKKSAETRETILRAAEALFEERGHFRVSVPEVAEKAGINHSTVYLYFANRDALLAAVCRHVAHRGQTIVNQAVDPNATARTRLESVVRGNFGMLYRPGDRWGIGNLISLFYFCCFEPSLLEVYREIEKSAVDRLETILIHGNREGAWTIGKPRETARAAHDLILAEAMKGFIDLGELPERDRADRTWRALLRLTGGADTPSRSSILRNRPQAPKVSPRRGSRKSAR